MKPYSEEVLKIKRLELLEETAKHYTLETRCEGDNGCAYSPVTADKVGVSEGCAIGRKLNKRLARHLDILGANGSAALFDLFGKLPKKIQKLDYNFLLDIQTLHDEQLFWNNEGLNENGQRYVEKIKDDYDLN